MPMHKAGVKESFNTGNVKVSITDWYNSAIRLESTDRNAIRETAIKIVNAWENYTDEELLEMGIPEEMISERINIQMYDEIIVH